jgi:nucleoside-diphosphate-sugar epimerase
MKIFITGANGFIGGNLCRRLAGEGHEIHALVRQENARMPTLPNVKFFQGDLTDLASIATAIRGCHQAYHVAGYAKLWAAKRKTFFDINVTGTENVLEAALKAGVKKLVFTSSCAVFGPSLNKPITEKDPRITAFNNDYDLSKSIAEARVIDYCKQGLETVVVNPSRVYGPGETTHANMITKMLIRCLNGRWVLMPGISDVIGNYAYIDDVIDGHINAMLRGTVGERYIVGGENLSYEEVIAIIGEEVKSPKLLALPAGAVKAWGFIELVKYRVTGNEPKFTSDSVGRYLRHAAFDCSKAIDQLGYSITGFREGICNTINYLKNRT